jgi:hypothetical protein
LAPEGVINPEAKRHKKNHKVPIQGNKVHYAEKQMKVLVNSNCELSLLKKE